MVCHDVAVDRAMYVELDAVNPLLEGPGEGGQRALEALACRAAMGDDV